jgi:surface protein
MGRTRKPKKRTRRRSRKHRGGGVLKDKFLKLTSSLDNILPKVLPIIKSSPNKFDRYQYAINRYMCKTYGAQNESCTDKNAVRDAMDANMGWLGRMTGSTTVNKLTKKVDRFKIRHSPLEYRLFAIAGIYGSVTDAMRLTNGFTQPTKQYTQDMLNFAKINADIYFLKPESGITGGDPTPVVNTDQTQPVDPNQTAEINDKLGKIDTMFSSIDRILIKDAASKTQSSDLYVDDIRLWNEYANTDGVKRARISDKQIQYLRLIYELIKDKMNKMLQATKKGGGTEYKEYIQGFKEYRLQNLKKYRQDIAQNPARYVKYLNELEPDQDSPLTSIGIGISILLYNYVPIFFFWIPILVGLITATAVIFVYVSNYILVIILDIITALYEYENISTTILNSVSETTSKINTAMGSINTKFRSLMPKTVIQTNKELRDRLNTPYKPDVTEWDVSKVTDMSYLFHNIRNSDFNQDISKWDVSNVTNMEGMFKDCWKFNQDISNWNVSKVTNMKEMFSGCKFNQPLADWERHDDPDNQSTMSNVTNMENMFYGCENFNQPLGNWNVSNVTNMKKMFYKCTHFNNGTYVIGDNTYYYYDYNKNKKTYTEDKIAMRNWDVSNVTNMISMFNYCSKFNQDISNWNVLKLDYKELDKKYSELDKKYSVKISKPTYTDEIFFMCPSMKEEYKPKLNPNPSGWFWGGNQLKQITA